MQATELERMATLRAVIGYLGEREQHGWWQCGFFGRGSGAFLSPVFPRTQILAQVTGVTQAAVLVHDERIGVGQVYHLFRLPEEIEQGIHRILYEPDVGERIAARVADVKAALSYLRASAGSSTAQDVGPVRVGEVASLYEPDSWTSVAMHYLRAFEGDLQVYPYFSEVK